MKNSTEVDVLVYMLFAGADTEGYANKQDDSPDNHGA